MCWAEGGGRVTREDGNEKSLTLSHCRAPRDPRLCKTYESDKIFMFSTSLSHSLSWEHLTRLWVNECIQRAARQAGKVLRRAAVAADRAASPYGGSRGPAEAKPGLCKETDVFGLHSWNVLTPA